jgi:hypothetical protein
MFLTQSQKPKPWEANSIPNGDDAKFADTTRVIKMEVTGVRAE